MFSSIILFLKKRKIDAWWIYSGCDGMSGYPTECSLCCKPYNVNWDCCWVLCPYFTCLFGQYQSICNFILRLCMLYLLYYLGGCDGVTFMALAIKVLSSELYYLQKLYWTSIGKPRWSEPTSKAGSGYHGSLCLQVTDNTLLFVEVWRLLHHLIELLWAVNRSHRLTR